MTKTIVSLLVRCRVSSPCLMLAAPVGVGCAMVSGFLFQLHIISKTLFMHFLMIKLDTEKFYRLDFTHVNRVRAHSGELGQVNRI